jgi:Predicted acyltransferases
MIVLDKNNDASFILDALRAIAAQAVCVGHAMSFFKFDYPRGIAIQVIGVLVFFVMSGFVIAHTLFSKEERGFGPYVIDRFARIYTAYLPAVILVVALDSILISLGLYDYQRFFSIKAIIANALMMQNHGYPFTGPTLGSGQPFWSVAIEFHIYIFVGALFFLRSSTRPGLMLTIAAMFCAVPIHFLYGSVDPGLAANGMFGLWLMGFSAYLLLKNGYLDLVPTRGLAVVCFLALAYFVGKQKPGMEYAVRFYIFLAVGIMALIAIARRTSWSVDKLFLKRAVRLFADYSYSLYLVHFPLMYFFLKFWEGERHVGFWIILIGSNVLAYCFYLAFEQHYREVARWVKGKTYRR